MNEWAVQINSSNSEADGPGRLRLVPGVRVLRSTADNALWLRGPHTSVPEVDNAVRAIAGRHYDVLADGQLRQRGQRVPHGYLPEGDWQPLCEWLTVELPVPGWAGVSHARVPLTLERGGQETAASLILSGVDDWVAFVDSAPVVRLDRLQFAASNDQRVVVMGQPLPSMPGQRFSLHDGIAVPAGWTWSPSIPAPMVRRVLSPSSDDGVLLWIPNEENRATVCELIPARAFVPASRSAVRATFGGGAHV